LSFKEFLKKKLKKRLKIFNTYFKKNKVELLNLKKKYILSYDLNTVLNYIEFSNEIYKDPYYFKTNKIYCLNFNFNFNHVIIYKKKKKNFQI
jgi:hypothetical protein